MATTLQAGIKLEFLIGWVHSQIISQAKRWEEKISLPLQFFLMGFFAFQILLLKDLFDKLPANTYELILSNLFEPVVFVCTLILVFFGLLSLAYSVGVAKIMKSLVDRKL